MKVLHRCVCLALLMGLAGVIQATAQTSSPRTATVLHLHGKARYASEDKIWHPLKNGVTLPAGSVIQTGENSTLDLQLGDSANTVKLVADSVLVIEQLTSESAGNAQTVDIELDLQAGQITGQVGKLSAASKYEIKFATGVAGIRYGAYRLSASGLVDVYNGLVAMATRDNGVKVVTEGQRFDPRTGVATEIPASSPADLSPAPAHSKPVPTPTPSSPAPAPKTPGIGVPLRKF